MAAMVNRGILNFLNQLDEGKRSRRNSFAERVANFLTPNDEFEYRGGLLTNMDGTSAMDRIGERTSYGTLGQANFAGNDPITSFPNQMPQGTMARGADATGGQIVRSLILPVDVMQAIMSSNLANKQGFVEMLEYKMNNNPENYNMIMSKPDGLSELMSLYAATNEPTTPSEEMSPRLQQMLDGIFNGTA
jgi:hypothetical protein